MRCNNAFKVLRISFRMSDPEFEHRLEAGQLELDVLKASVDFADRFTNQGVPRYSAYISQEPGNAVIVGVKSVKDSSCYASSLIAVKHLMKPGFVVGTAITQSFAKAHVDFLKQRIPGIYIVGE